MEVKSVQDKVVLPRVYNFTNCVWSIICLTIGFGIFVVPQFVFAELRSPWACLSVWLAAGVVTLLTALCYVELAQTYPISGSDYVYVHEAFGSIPAFLVLFAQAILRKPAVIASAALTFATYFSQIFWTGCQAPEHLIKILANLAILFLCSLNMMSTKSSIGVMGASTIAKLGGLVALIAAGFASLLIDPQVSEGGQVLTSGAIPQLGAFVKSFLMCYWCSGGFFFVNNVVDEIKEPVGKTILQSVVVSVIIVIFTYTSLNVIILVLLSPEEILASKAIIITLATKISPHLHLFAPVVVSFSTFGLVNSDIVMCSRMALAGTKNGHMPTALSLVQLGTKTPIASCLLNCLVALIMVNLGFLKTLVSFISYLNIFCISLGIVSLFYLRTSQPNLERPFKLPLVLITLICCFKLFILAYPFYSDPIKTMVGIGLMLVSVPLFLICTKSSDNPNSCAKQVSHKFLIAFQKLFLACPEGAQLK